MWKLRVVTPRCGGVTGIVDRRKDIRFDETTFNSTRLNENTLREDIMTRREDIMTRREDIMTRREDITNIVRLLALYILQLEDYA